MRPPSIMAGKGARVYAKVTDYPTPPGNVGYNPLKQYRSSLTAPDNNYQTFSDWSLNVKSDLQKITTTISHGEQYLPGIISGDITLNGLISSEGYMGYYIGQLVNVQLDWSSYFTSPLLDTKTIRIPVTISDIDRTANVKEAYKVTVRGKLNWMFDYSNAPQGWLIPSVNVTQDFGYTPETPSISVISPATFPYKDSPFYV